MSEQPEFTPEWLTLREAADAAARDATLPALLGDRLARHPMPAGAAERPAGPEPADRSGDGLVIRDLGCGTGSMGRWLAGRLPGPQRWMLHDRDPVLLSRAVAGVTGPAADGRPVTAVAEPGDLTLLRADRLTGTSLVTASALLDLLTAEEVSALAVACAAAGCPALLTLTVTGRVELDPAEPLDAEISAAFNAHQRRVAGDRHPLGPDAAAGAADAFARHGAEVHRRPSPWRLGPEQSALTAEWLRGWVGAAVEQRPDLAAPAAAYLRRRLAACDAGDLRAVVHHEDLLALPPRGDGR
ncbi:hypothetical protein Sru01_17580 [Sphaerisporangium rufum]|uniref:SAM-dependent methyltransferase n=1 Tax=Sphaerisporangium rufum TaxID=1381558 RepID=A0A919QZ48_9ACTN|nr:SAM-dependent methyltransferase [Sphaerisporangium rufum]GII76776.1 hypothetical protein Sru01_17580 [Sphaerisporangium rufum]